MKRMIFLFLASCLVANGACLARGTWALQDKSEKGKAPKNQTAVPSAQNSQADAEYKIGAQDVLQIDVWKEAEITRSVPVRPDGKITLEFAECIGACDGAPACLREDKHVMDVTPEKADKLIEELKAV